MYMGKNARRYMAAPTFIYMHINSFYDCFSSVFCNLMFPSVPNDLVTSVSLTPPNPTGIVGSSIDLTCTAVLSTDVSGAMIDFDYGFIRIIMAAVSGTTQTHTTAISPLNISSAGEYTCTVTVTASGVCGSEPACPTKISDPIYVTVLSEYVCTCN